MPILCSIEPQETALRAPERAVVVHQNLGHDEQRDALGAGRRAFDAGQHQMDDVFRQVVLAGRDEDLLAGDGVAAVQRSATALVLSSPRSVPHCGSVRFMVPLQSPAIILGA